MRSHSGRIAVKKPQARMERSARAGEGSERNVRHHRARTGSGGVGAGVLRDLRAHAAFALPRRGHLVAGDELKQAQRQRLVGREFVRIAQEDQVARDGELGVRQPRTPVAEVRQHRALAGLGGLQLGLHVEPDGGGVAIPRAHPLGRVRPFGKGRRGERVLRLEVEQVLIARCTEMEKGAHRGQDADRRFVHSALGRAAPARASAWHGCRAIRRGPP